MLNDRIKTSIKIHAAQKPDEEVCGLIIDNNCVFPCQNTHTDKKNNFTINETDYLMAGNLGSDVTAIYHTHLGKNKEFSIKDKINSENLNIKYILYVPELDEFSVYSPIGYRFDYIGRSFNIGFTDCYTLLVDFYKKEFNIEIPNVFPDRTEDWFIKKPSIMQDSYEKLGFKVIGKDVKEAQYGDVILVNYLIENYPSHVMIYTGNNTVLHHPRGTFSVLEDLIEPITRRINVILRHKDKC